MLMTARIYGRLSLGFPTSYFDFQTGQHCFKSHRRDTNAVIQFPSGFMLSRNNLFISSPTIFNNLEECAKIITLEAENMEMMHKSQFPAEKDNRKYKKQYTAQIIPAWCKSCGICSAFCPKKVIGSNDMGAPVIERPDECIGCRFCELHCPDFAITIKEIIIKTQGNQ